MIIILLIALVLVSITYLSKSSIVNASASVLKISYSVAIIKSIVH